VPVEQDIDLGNGGKLTMVLIPPGEFGMGSTTEEQARFLEEARAAGDQWAVDRIPTEGPQHRVRITRPFCLGKYEVTQAQWEAVMGSSPSHFADNPFHPVERVSWDDIQPFLDKLNVAGTRRVPSANGGKSEPSEMTFTLPTEAQWEYACRAGTTTFWHCGDDEATLQEYAWFSVDSRGKTHPVGELQANGFGLHDMHGNVWEWCADYWATDYYAESASNDPSGPSAGSYRVRRGGRWCDHAGHCRSAIRDDASPDYRVGSLGFRLASVLADERAESGASETEGGKPAAHAPEAEASSAEGEAVSPPDTSAWKEVLPSGQGTFRTTPSPASASARFLSSTSTATPSPPSDVSPTPPRVTQRVPQCAPCTTRYRGKNPM